MTTKVEKSIIVNVPVSRAYNQWTQFEEFPHFMGGVTQVTQLGDDRLEWVAEIAGVKRRWEARILEQVPDQKVSWAATEGATNAGEVRFEDLGGGQTSVHLSLSYEPEGVVEKIGDQLNIVEKQAEGDLERFKEFIESEGYASGAWRGTVNPGAATGTPDATDAAASRGDSGKAGISGKAAAVAAAGAGVAAAAGAAMANKDKKDKKGSADEDEVMVTEETVFVAEPGTGAVTQTGAATDTGLGTPEAAGTAETGLGASEPTGSATGTVPPDPVTPPTDADPTDPGPTPRA